MNKQFNIGDKLTIEDIKVGMIVDIVPKLHTNIVRKYINVSVIKTEHDWFDFKEGNCIIGFSNWKEFDVILKNYINVVDACITPTQQQSPLDEQSIADAIKTLSRASQELSTHVTVDGKGVVTVYSDYHQEDLVFDTAEKLVQYMKCVEQMSSFVKEQGENYE